MKKKKTVREYLYIDEELVDSLLSQMKNGLVKAITRTKQSISGHDSQKSIENTLGGKIGIKGNGVTDSINIGSNRVEKEQELSSLSFNTVYYDYAVDIIENLLNLSLSKETGSAFENDFILSRETFNILNFSEISTLLSTQVIEKELLKQEEFDKSDLDLIKDASEMFGDTNYIKIGKNLVIPKNEKFRVSEAQLQLFKNSRRNLTILGIIESKLSKKDFDLSSTTINNLRGVTTLNILKSLDVVDEHSRLVLPIALYFK